MRLNAEWHLPSGTKMEAIKAIPPTMNPYANGGTLQIIHIFIRMRSMVKCLKIGVRAMNKYIL